MYSVLYAVLHTNEKKYFHRKFGLSNSGALGNQNGPLIHLGQQCLLGLCAGIPRIKPGKQVLGSWTKGLTLSKITAWDEVKPSVPLGQNSRVVAAIQGFHRSVLHLNRQSMDTPCWDEVMIAGGLLRLG